MFRAEDPFKLNVKPEAVDSGCFVQATIENTSKDKDIFLQKVKLIQPPPGYEAIDLNKTEGTELFEKAGAFKNGDKRNYLF